MKPKSVADTSRKLRERIGRERMAVIETGLRSYEQRCEDMWNDLVFKLHVQTKLSESTIERVMDFL